MYAANANNLDINCNQYGGCQDMVIYPSYTSEYSFSLYCVAEEYSCYRVNIKIPNSQQFTENYMELICPQTNRDTHCNILWYCLDLSTSSSSTATTFDTTNYRYICNDNDCCPWSDPDNMIQNSTNPFVIPYKISPTTTNSTGEYYILSTTTTYKPIYCNIASGCYIECIAESSCASAYIYAGKTNNLTLICSGKSSCTDIYITEGPMFEANIDCTANLGYACTNGVFFMSETKNINVKCDHDTCSGDCSNYGGCYSIQLWAQHADYVDVDCKYIDCQLSRFHLDSITNKATLTATGTSSLWSTTVYAANANELEINCDNYNGCSMMNIYPPYQSEYAFSLYCVAETYSCEDVDIYLPDSNAFTTNYMELICPRTNRQSTNCDIRWRCLDLSTLTITNFDTTNYRYICDDDVCCPWSNPDNMIQNTTDPAIIPQTYAISATTVNSTGEYYILSTATSYKAIYCNIASGCYIECNGESSCASAYIYAGKTNNLTLICSGKSSCTDIYITEGPMIEANVDCIANLGYACTNGVFIMSKPIYCNIASGCYIECIETKNINLKCSSPSFSSCPTSNCLQGGCYSLNLWAQNADYVDVDCKLKLKISM
eukprot:10065_1